MKLWDYVVHQGRTGLVVLDLGNDMKRVAFQPPTPKGQSREASIPVDELAPATEGQKATAMKSGLTRDSQRSYLPPR